jgi:hypothetical protein
VVATLAPRSSSWVSFHHIEKRLAVSAWKVVRANKAWWNWERFIRPYSFWWYLAFAPSSGVLVVALRILEDLDKLESRPVGPRPVVSKKTHVAVLYRVREYRLRWPQSVWQ